MGRGVNQADVGSTAPGRYTAAASKLLCAVLTPVDIDCDLDILPAMNDQDSHRSPGGNVLRFALRRQGQNSHVSTRWHGMPCRGLTLVLANSAGLGYRPTDLNTSPGTHRRKGFLPARGDRISTLGEIR
jgi:hypothetical protein